MRKRFPTEADRRREEDRRVSLALLTAYGTFALGVLVVLLTSGGPG